MFPEEITNNLTEQEKAHTELILKQYQEAKTTYDQYQKLAEDSKATYYTCLGAINSWKVYVANRVQEVSKAQALSNTNSLPPREAVKEDAKDQWEKKDKNKGK